jgi:signal transduction histidine kinase
MTVQLEAVRAVWSDSPDEARAMVNRTTAMAREGLSEARRALQALRSSPLEDLGLVLAIRQLAETLREHTGANVRLDLPSNPLTLPAPVEQGVYRIAQEAIENVERHAIARNVHVMLSCDGGRLQLRIEDDGCGFDPDGVTPDRYGVAGIRERADLLGAAIRVESAVGRGTRVQLDAPMAQGVGE